jgi:hypothetical protein
MHEKEEFSKIQEKHLSLLTSYGRYYVGTLEDAAVLLHSDFLGAIELSREEKRDLFMTLVETAKKHKELIISSILERQKYVDSNSE